MQKLETALNPWFDFMHIESRICTNEYVENVGVKFSKCIFGFLEISVTQINVPSTYLVRRNSERLLAVAQNFEKKCIRFWCTFFTFGISWRSSAKINYGKIECYATDSTNMHIFNDENRNFTIQKYINNNSYEFLEDDTRNYENLYVTFHRQIRWNFHIKIYFPFVQTIKLYDLHGY